MPDAFPGRGIKYESTPPLIPLYKGVRGQAQKEKERYLQDLHVLLKRYLQDLHVLLKRYFQDLHVLLKRYFQDLQKRPYRNPGTASRPEDEIVKQQLRAIHSEVHSRTYVFLQIYDQVVFYEVQPDH